MAGQPLSCFFDDCNNVSYIRDIKESYKLHISNQGETAGSASRSAYFALVFRCCS